eukprot:4410795-Amphidinium_carterae.1
MLTNTLNKNNADTDCRGQEPMIAASRSRSTLTSTHSVVYLFSSGGSQRAPEVLRQQRQQSLFVLRSMCWRWDLGITLLEFGYNWEKLLVAPQQTIYSLGVESMIRLTTCAKMRWLAELDFRVASPNVNNRETQNG